MSQPQIRATEKSAPEIRRALQAISNQNATHTHVKADITDLETITTTPTASAVPKAYTTAQIDIGWVPPLAIRRGWFGL